MTPTRSDIPQNLDGKTEEEVRELATAYLDLLGLLLDAIDACESDTCVVGWSGRGFWVDGHVHEEGQ